MSVSSKKFFNEGKKMKFKEALAVAKRCEEERNLAEEEKNQNAKDESEVKRKEYDDKQNKLLRMFGKIERDFVAACNEVNYKKYHLKKIENEPREFIGKEFNLVLKYGNRDIAQITVRIYRTKEDVELIKDGGKNDVTGFEKLAEEIEEFFCSKINSIDANE